MASKALRSRRGTARQRRRVRRRGWHASWTVPGMLTLHALLVLAPLAPLAPPVAPSTSAPVLEAWRKVAGDEKVVVFARPHPGTDVHEVKAVAVLDFSAELLAAIVADVDGYPQLIPHTTEARVVGTDSSALAV